MSSTTTKLNEIIDIGDLIKIKLHSKKYGELFTLIDKKNYNRVKNFRWHCKGVKPYLYAATYLGTQQTGKLYTILMHRLLTSFEGENVDHVNGNTLDNTEKNIRPCSRFENGLNKKVYKNQKLSKGVSKRNNRFRARITFNKKTVTIGNYDTIEEANKAYELAAKELFGKFKREVTKDEPPVIHSEAIN